MREPDFKNILDVLKLKRPNRPVLFEFFLNGPLYERIVGDEIPPKGSDYETQILVAKAYAIAGYDYVTMHASNFGFPKPQRTRMSTYSLNDAPCITDNESFLAYEWMDPEAADYSYYDAVKNFLPKGMKLIMHGPGGVLENVIGLVGYDNLCIMIYDEPELAEKIFYEVGSRLLRYYEIGMKHDLVGAIVGNDDWGFNSQTMLGPADMRKYVFPWHKKIVAAAHKLSKPAILHSCGNLLEVMGDVINDIKYNAKHSYEDVIQPVEEAYEELVGKIAVLGGIDVDFICRETPEAVAKRSKAMLERTKERGGYALGSGNSIPEYVPQEGYFAMIKSIY